MPDERDEDQRKRFEDAAKELGVDLDEDRLKAALKKIVPEKKEASDDEE